MIETKTTPSLDDRIENHMDDDLREQDPMMPDSLERTIERLAATLQEIPLGVRPGTIEEQLKEFSYKILMIAGVKLL